jgi:SP family general alpha glucoside:H+ symporter-like MFS transporter
MPSPLEPVNSGKASVAAMEAPVIDSADMDFTGKIHDAQVATTKEHSMSLWKGVKLYPKAIGWSILLSTAIVMEGQLPSPMTSAGS